MNADRTLRIDLNCDMGESFGAYRLGRDEEVMPHVTSISIACGYHAGDPATMRATVKRALEHGVAVGAHPGLPDREGFGRRAMRITPQEAHDLALYQIGALNAFVKAEGGVMQHVKPHGALYNMAAADPELAAALAEAAYAADPELILFGLAGSELIAAGRRIGVRTAGEAFSDRAYQPDGSLVPRPSPGALIEDEERAAQRVIRMVEEGKVFAAGGTDIAVQAETVCIHGDEPNAPRLALALRARLRSAGIEVRAFLPPRPASPER